MCTPELAAAAGMSQGALAFQTVSTLVSVAGFVSQGQAANFQASVQRRNVIIAERKAVDAEQRGQTAKAKKALQTRQLIGRQRVAQAGQGQRVDFGSALELVQDTAQIGKLDELQIKANAEREALGFRTQGLNFESSAALADLRAESAILEGEAGVRAAGFGVAKTLISDVGKVAFPKKPKPKPKPKDIFDPAAPFDDF